MAIDPATGMDDGVAKPPASGTVTPQSTSSPTADRVNGLLTQGNPYIEQAKSAGMDVANSRGLQNSSIAAGESQKAAYAAAVPIATNDANIGATKDLQTSQIASTEKIATAGNVSQQAIAQMNIDASAKQQANAIISQEKIASQQITSQADLAKLQAATQTAIANLNISDADKQQLLSLAQQERQSQTTKDTQLQIANMNVSSNQQDKTAAAAVSYANVYSSMVNAINSNKDIPADARAAYLANAKTLYDNGLGLVEQTYNVNLDWGFSPPAASTATGGGTAGDGRVVSEFANAGGFNAQPYSGPVGYDPSTGRTTDSSGNVTT